MACSKIVHSEFMIKTDMIFLFSIFGYFMQNSNEVRNLCKNFFFFLGKQYAKFLIISFSGYAKCGPM